MNEEKNNMSMVIWTFKPIGWTPFDCVAECRKLLTNEKKGSKNNEKPKKLVFAGRLDPMACGLLPIIVNGYDHKEVKLKMQDSYKTYQFSVIIGLATDTYDILGIASKRNVDKSAGDPLQTMIARLDKIKSSKIQSYPPYSSKTVYSEHHKKKICLWQLAKEGMLPDVLPQRDIDIKQLTLLQTEIKNNHELFSIIEKRINTLPKKANFRQIEILERWSQLLDLSKDEQCEQYTVCHLEARVSVGTYVRTIGDDLGGVVYDICRTSIDSKNLEKTGIYNKFDFSCDLDC